MTIPPKIILSGNEGAASAFVGLGKKNLRTLQKDMSFQSLPTGKVIRQIDEFTQIEVVSRYGESVISITSTAPEEEYGGVFSCFCECGISVGADISPYFDNFFLPATDPKISPIWKDVEGPTIVPSAQWDVSFCRLDKQARNKGVYAFDWFDYRRVGEVYGVVPEREYYIPGEEPIKRKLIEAHPCVEDKAIKYIRGLGGHTTEDDMLPTSLEVQGAHRTIYG